MSHKSHICHAIAPSLGVSLKTVIVNNATVACHRMGYFRFRQKLVLTASAFDFEACGRNNGSYFTAVSQSSGRSSRVEPSLSRNDLIFPEWVFESFCALSGILPVPLLKGVCSTGEFSNVHRSKIRTRGIAAWACDQPTRSLSFASPRQNL